MKKQNKIFRLPRRFTSRNNRKGYTLAEVIIAVAIIGTLATLTISTYMTGSPSQNNQYVAGLKKAYAQLSYATDQIKANNSGTMVGAISADSYSLLRDKYCTYLKCTKICDNPVTDGCWPSNFKTLQGAATSLVGTYRGAILNDGTFILFSWSHKDCDDSHYTISGNNLACGLITIDINGLKSPNIQGRDIFYFYSYQTGIVPDGDIGTAEVIGSGWSCDPTYVSFYSGYGCAAKILQEGKMLY